MTRAYIWLEDQVSGSVRFYENASDILRADKISEVETVLKQAQAHLDAGRHVAGFVAFEAGYALEKKLNSHMPTDREGPLVLLGVFDEVRILKVSDIDLIDTNEDEIGGGGLQATLGWLRPDLNETDYLKAFDRVQAYINAGDVYQINLTFPMRAPYSGSALQLYKNFRAQQPSAFGGIIEMDGHSLVSFSPELFFEKRGSDIRLKPMKGTAARRQNTHEDAVLRDSLKDSVKSQAENLMIVDLLRNDVSRLAVPGSVKVPQLFSLETYPTLHQMTSTVTAKAKEGITVTDIMKALFPCGSVTGAPKIRAIEIIRELETVPREAYCGAMGYFAPNGDACFNVTIRTAQLNKGLLRYDVGSGVVADSIGSDEYQECLLKARIFDGAQPRLIETFKWIPDKGAVRLDRHLDRLKRSAEALNFTVNLAAIQKHVETLSARVPQRVRLSMGADGVCDLNYTELVPLRHDAPMRVALSAEPLTQLRQEFRYKVDHRDFYDGELSRLKAVYDVDDVILFNAKDQACEGTFTSLFIQPKHHPQLLTPALVCGLLPGVLRAELIETGQAREAIISQDDILQAERVFIGNSLRGLMEAVLVSKKRI